MSDLTETHALARRLLRGCEDALARVESSGVSSGLLHVDSHTALLIRS